MAGLRPCPCTLARRERVGLVGSAAGGDVGGGCSYSCAYDEPKGIAAEASPESSSFRGGDGGFTLTGEGIELGEIIRVILLGGG